MGNTDKDVQQTILDVFKYFKIAVYVPKSHLEDMLDHLDKIEINHIGNYKNCMSWYETRGYWTTLEGAKPFIGNVNERSIEDEYKIEFLCPSENVMEVVEYIKRVHPYEELVVDVMPLLALS